MLKIYVIVPDFGYCHVVAAPTWECAK